MTKTHVLVFLALCIAGLFAVMALLPEPPIIW